MLSIGVIALSLLAAATASPVPEGEDAAPITTAPGGEPSSASLTSESPSEATTLALAESATQPSAASTEPNAGASTEPNTGASTEPNGGESTTVAPRSSAAKSSVMFSSAFTVLALGTIL